MRTHRRHRRARARNRQVDEGCPRRNRAAVEMGFFVAGEGRRFYGKTTTSAVPNKTASILRQPLGVAGLIIAANTPIANVAWKAFPALLCGNTAVMKPSEDTPYTAWRSRAGPKRACPPACFNGSRIGAGSRGAAGRDRRRGRRQLHRVVRGGPLGGARPGSGWPRSAWSWVARIRWWCATTPTWTRRWRRRSVRLQQRRPALRRRQPLLVFDARLRPVQDRLVRPPAG